jgi:hypothetical protein
MACRERRRENIGTAACGLPFFMAPEGGAQKKRAFPEEGPS